jgi:hypothetical protein
MARTARAVSGHDALTERQLAPFQYGHGRQDAVGGEGGVGAGQLQQAHGHAVAECHGGLLDGTPAGIGPQPAGGLAGQAGIRLGAKADTVEQAPVILADFMSRAILAVATLLDTWTASATVMLPLGCTSVIRFSPTIEPAGARIDARLRFDHAGFKGGSDHEQGLHGGAGFVDIGDGAVAQSGPGSWWRGCWG